MRTLTTLLIASFLTSPLPAESPIPFVPRLVTKTPTLPADQAGYYYSASHDPVAYASDAVTMIQIKPVNPSLLATLVLDLPEQISLISAVRAIDIGKPTALTKNGQAYHRYLITPRSKQSTKFTFFWKSTLPPGTESTAYFHAKWPDGQQPEQQLQIKTIALKKGRTFENIPVWFTIPSDLAEAWNSPDSYRRGGFNTIDLWSYLSPEEKSWGQPLVQRTTQQFRKVGIEVWAWPQDWWWKKGRETDEGRSTGITGERHPEFSLNYRGKHFQDWITAGKILIDQGLYTHTTDPEIYRNVDEKVGFSPESKKRFISYLAEQKIKVTESDPSVFMANHDAHTEAVAAWRQWRAKRYTDFFVEYRQAMEAHMRAKGITDPFRLIIYSTYHRHWNSFYESDDHREADPYLITLEDPVDLAARAFEIISPMTYPELYTTSGQPDQTDLLDMTRTWKDTFSLEKLTRGHTPVMPLLSSGYPYSVYENDVSAEMLADFVRESFAGGARGLGIWGEGIHDARDMQAVGEVIDQLVPAEEVILTGTPFTAETIEGVAFVKGLTSRAGALILVSEYSDKERAVTIASPLAGSVIDLQTGKTIGKIDTNGGTFRTTLSKNRAKMFLIKPS